jgi:CheY-like chemotaxis protein
MKRPSQPSLPAVLKAIADPKSWFIFRAIASESLESDTLLKMTKLTPKQYYSRISEMTNAGLVIRKKHKHYLTSLGRVVYESQVTIQKAINKYWKLKAIDSFGDVPEKEQLIKQLVDDNDLFELLARIPYSTSSDIISSSSNDSLVNSSIYSAGRRTKGKSSLNLMLIEDDLDTALTFETILKSQGYNVETFTESFEALKHFIKLNGPYYDLIISDIRMPGMNGIQLYQKLKSIDNDVRVIFLTALDASYELLSIMPEIKKSHIIRKPVSSENFISVIERALSSSHPVSYVSQ